MRIKYIGNKDKKRVEISIGLNMIFEKNEIKYIPDNYGNILLRTRPSEFERIDNNDKKLNNGNKYKNEKNIKKTKNNKSVNNTKSEKQDRGGTRKNKKGYTVNNK